MLPNLIVPGFPRTGTTWLYRVFESPPDFFVPVRKEIHYFDRNFHRGVGWYERYFHGANGQRWLADINPNYIQVPDVLGRMRGLIPDAKVMIVVRDPLERLYSEYELFFRTRRLKVSFSERVRDSEFLRRSLYCEKIGEYIDVFGESNVLVLVYEDLLADPRAYVEQILRFLDVPRRSLKAISPDLLHRRVNSNVEVRSVRLHRALHRLQRAGRHQHRPVLDKLLDLTRDVYYKVFAVRRKATKPTLELRGRIAPFYRQDVDRLSEMLDRDLSAVWGAAARHH